LYVQVRALENRIPVVAPNVCGDMYGGRSILVAFDYDKKTDIAVARRIVGSIKDQTFALDIDLDRVRKIREARLKDLKSNFTFLSNRCLRSTPKIITTNSQPCLQIFGHLKIPIVLHLLLKLGQK
jgi:predicted amidohydrolase